MTMIPLRVIIEGDATLLFERALLNKTVCAFGEDGFGMYGKNFLASYFTINAISVCVTTDDDDSPSVFMGSVILFLKGYNSNVTGHICTDQNFWISISEHLKNASIDPSCLTWSNITFQGNNYVCFDIDLGVLLGWS